MKHLFLSVLAYCSLFGAVSCTADRFLEEDLEPGDIAEVRMSASNFQSENLTKTNLDITENGAKFTWADNDTVGIFPDAGSQAFFPMIAGAGTSTASFTGGGWSLKSASAYYAYYPFVKNLHIDKTNLLVKYNGQLQTGNNSTGEVGSYDYMVAIGTTPEGGKLNFNFQHIGALLQIKAILPAPISCASLTLETERKVLVEKGSVDLTSVISNIVAINKTNELTVDLYDVETTVSQNEIIVYMMIPPADLSNEKVMVKVKDFNGNTYSGEVSNPKNYIANRSYIISSVLTLTESSIDVQVNTAGGLSAILPMLESNTSKITISGNLNQTDIAHLKSLIVKSEKNIVLDLSLAKISRGSSPDFLDTFAFSGCEKLQSIFLPYSLVSIGSDAFSGCSNLRDVKIGNNLKYIYSNAFSGCVNLKDVKLSNSLVNIDENAFKGCVGLTQITIPGSVSSLFPGAFSGCSNLRTLVFEESKNVLSIQNIQGYNQNKVFNNCPLESVSVFRNLEGRTNNFNVFGVTTIKSVYIGKAVTKIPEDFLSGCKELTSISLPNGLISIGSGAFSETNLETIAIPTSVKNIESYAFFRCEKIKSIKIPNNVHNIGEAAFKYMISLTSVTVGSGITAIPNGAFWRDESLEEIVIPANVKSIGSDGFYNCVKLKRIHVKSEMPPTLGSTVFNGIDSNAIFYIPKGSLESYKTASGWSSFNYVED